MLERLASKALLGEPFGKVAADRMLRGFAAKEDITVAASRLRATVDRRPGSRVDHQSSRADIPWPLRPIAERRRARRNGLAAKSVRVTALGLPTNGRRRGLALFERGITASERRARVRGVLVMAGGRSTAVTRRSLRASRSGEAAGSAEPLDRLGGQPWRRPHQTLKAPNRHW
jgi:hypothetical protein